MIYIFDLDGTLADCTHRLPLIQSKPARWDEFHAACVQDAPIVHVCEILDALILPDSPNAVQVWTGREESTRDDTLRWFEQNGYRRIAAYLRGGGTMRMRPAGDYRPGHELKQAWLLQFSTIVRSVVCAFEDDLRCATMYRQAGAQCIVVGNGGQS